jgi:hypothetical protein
MEISEWVRRWPGSHGVVDSDECDAPPTPKAIATDVDEDPIEPGLEVLRIAKGSRCRPGAKESVLRGVLGLVRVPKDEASKAVSAIELAVGKPREWASALIEHRRGLVPLE